MEVIKYALIPMVWGISVLCFIISLISFLVRKVCNKETNKTKQKLIIFAVCASVSFAIIGTYERSPDVITPTNHNVTSQTSGSVDSDTLGQSRENPIEITAEELALEIEVDIDQAKIKYNGKWVKITGTISDTSDGGNMYGYYIFGKKSTLGYTGLRIMCWCADGPYSGSVLGDTQTFVGQVLEITTVNATEIVDCVRVQD